MSTLNSTTESGYHAAMAKSLKAGPRKVAPLHPGEIIRGVLEDKKLGLRQVGRAIGVTPTALSNVLEGKSSVTPAMALRIGRYFGNGPDLWLKLQADYDLYREELALRDQLAQIEPLPND